ncbi:hypothetical protein CV_0282 [Chromobacterium violaceum ATCC 12472]|uniref:Uncharacterized protein n=1 Tax=Chromobacterium violaceum (strain ATCC 12472 / DSM 30191 / JCM 1249 / CCUG 213 / NBRC 12614 / NCIMB 9131 / NCTC 9757 / MK) TaxID=243365 RepID=Q7P1D1_CHRVO|nr:hypothetical protein CV_0282 [Chromobacterium violaceum ATCC 12472]
MSCSDSGTLGGTAGLSKGRTLASWALANALANTSASVGMSGLSMAESFGVVEWIARGFPLRPRKCLGRTFIINANSTEGVS